MTKIALILLLAGPSFAADHVRRAEKDIRVESRFVNSLATTEFFPPPAAGQVDNSSGTYLPDRKRVFIFNTDSTATNWIYISSYAMVTASIDTTKAEPIPGSTGREFSWGPNIRMFLFRAAGTGRVTGRAEQ